LVLSETAVQPDTTAAPTLELLWQDDATAFAVVRGPSGELSPAPLDVGLPAVSDVAGETRAASGRRLSLAELLDLETQGLPLGDTAEVVLAVLSRARRSVAEGLVHPHLEPSDGLWHALWGATLDDVVAEELRQIADAAPAVSAEAFEGDADAFVQDLYGCAVDELARRALRSARLRPAPSVGRAGAAEHLLAGLLAGHDSALPAHNGYAALERRLSTWVDAGLSHRSRAPWNVAVRLSERDGGDGAVIAELWLTAADDPALALPASLLSDGGESVFGFLRDRDPREAIREHRAAIESVLRDAGVPALDDHVPRAVLEPDQVRALLRDAMPRLEELGVPVLLPREWMARQSHVRLNLVATGSGRPSGTLGAEALARFDWRVAIGEVELTDEELLELVAAQEPLVRLRGRWHAVQASEVERALRFLERRSGGASVVDLARAVAGVETDDAGLELGTVTLDESLSALVEGGDALRYRPRTTPAGMRHALFPFQERGHGWLRLLGDLGAGGILADDMGLGKTVQAIATLLSEREDGSVVGPTLVVSPMSVVRQWMRELARFAPGLVVHLHHGPDRLAGDALTELAAACDVVVTSYDVATRDVAWLERVAWDRLILDEAQDAKNPATKRHRALRRIPRRRALALTGTPIENALGELWAIMDLVNPGLLGSRQAFERTFARPIEAAHDARALERLRGLVGPFLLRRAKDAPEVELELPPITIEKVPCHLTVEQAGLYRATVDHWMPRIEEHERRFDRRGAVLAMLGQLKQVCNHPELVLRTGAPLEGRSGKLERLVRLLQAVPAGDRSLVFTQYPGFERLAPHLADRLGSDVGFFHGRLSARAREELLARFDTDSGPRVLVISLRAGGRGLNLPVANHVVHFDRWWNPAVEQQATDRVYRFGQRKHVYVTSLICTATVEERIDQLLEAKRELADQVIAGRADDWLAELDLDTLRAAVSLAPEAIEDAA
jgi:SNF2-related domain/SNF2 Helicase protein/Helicase conserved C-terminal domain